MYPTYLKCFDYYQRKYGALCIVLMQVGKFYELYGLDTEDIQEGLTREMSELLNIIRTRKDKRFPQGPNNPLMVGFPTASLERYLRILIEHRWTVVVIDQVADGVSLPSDSVHRQQDPEVNEILASHVKKCKAKTPSSNVVHRFVRAVYSPSTYLNHNLNQEHNYLLCIYFEGESVSKSKSTDTDMHGGPAEAMVKTQTQLLTVGLAALDLTTGQSLMYETYSLTEDRQLALDEAYRFLSTYPTEEVILASRGLEDISAAGLISYLDIDEQQVSLQLKYNSVPARYYNLEYQQEFLKKVFPETGLLSPIEYLELEARPTTVISLCLLLQFAYEHDEQIVTRLDKPVYWTPDRHLVLASNCIQQLDLAHVSGNGSGSGGGSSGRCNRSKFSSIFNLIDQTLTGLGRRLLKERLLNPIRMVGELQLRYRLIEEIRQEIPAGLAAEIEQQIKTQQMKPLTGANGFKTIDQVIARELRLIGCDLERLHRKMSLGMLHPNQLNELDQGYRHLGQLVKIINACGSSASGASTPSNFLADKLLPADFSEKLEKYQEYYLSILDLEETQKYHLNQIEDSFFHKGHYPQLDELSEQIRHYQEYFNKLTRLLSRLIKPTGSAPQIYLKATDVSGHYLQLTSPRYAILKKALGKEPLVFKLDGQTYRVELADLQVIRETQTKATGSGSGTGSGGETPDDSKPKPKTKSKKVNLSFPKMQEISARLGDAITVMQEQISKVYHSFLSETYRQNNWLFEQMHRLVAQVDLYQSQARTARQYGYCLPKVYEDKERAWLRARQVRHPLTEQIHQHVKYVPHDIDLGCGADADGAGIENDIEGDSGEDVIRQDGLLVFGLNGIGKSLLMQSVGVAVILAQAGFTVPAQEFHFSPYQYVLTRILGNDNKFKGQSSFAVEMIELRGILSRANRRSLVLGDEICRGTETYSALSLVSSGVIEFAERQTNFIFATHLHQLAHIPEVAELPNLGICHLNVTCDADNNVLIYHRNLLPGPGHPIYGIEVARAIGLDTKFIQRANQIRQKIMKVQPLLMSDKTSQYNSSMYIDGFCRVCRERPGEEINHISPQRAADKNKFIGHFHKNIKGNLILLCKPCHYQVEHPVDGKLLVIDGYQTGAQAADQLKFHYQDVTDIADVTEDIAGVDVDVDVDTGSDPTGSISKIRPVLRSRTPLPKIRMKRL